MNIKQEYLKGKSVFIVSVIVIIVVVFTVYFTGMKQNRSLTSNMYIELVIVASALFLFMSYGLYKGIGLVDNFPKFKSFKLGNFIASSGTVPDISGFDVAGEGIGGLIVSVLLWIVMTIAAVVLLILLEAFLWFSIFILLSMLYWVFFRALKFVFSKSENTKGILSSSIAYSIAYTAMYTAWMFGVVYLSEVLN